MNRTTLTRKHLTGFLIHYSPYFKILNFNFKAAQELPVYSHDLEGQVSPVVIEGEGEFLSKGWKYRFPRRQRMY